MIENYLVRSIRYVEDAVQLAKNIVVHDPETNIARIDTTRLHAHGWADEVVQPQVQRGKQASADAPAVAPSTTRY
jgi:hypothetical protein